MSLVGGAACLVACRVGRGILVGDEVVLRVELGIRRRSVGGRDFLVEFDLGLVLVGRCFGLVLGFRFGLGFRLGLGFGLGSGSGSGSGVGLRALGRRAIPPAIATVSAPIPTNQRKTAGPKVAWSTPTSPKLPSRPPPA